MSRYEPVFPLEPFLPRVTADLTVDEPARRVPVIAEADIVVVGGGPAGACAAAAAARAGASVVVLERQACLGGQATAASVTIWHSIYGTDHATKVIGGLPEELIRKLQSWHAIRNHREDGETGPWVIDTEQAKLAFDDLAIGSGVKLLFDVQFAGSLVEEGRVKAVLIEGKSGRQAILGNVFIDATGDADLVRRAGAPTQLGDGQGRCQAPTLCFRIAGRKPQAAPLGQAQALLFRDPMPYNGEHYACFLWGSQGLNDPSEMMLAGTRVVNVNAADTLSLSRAELEARYQLRFVLDKLRELPGWEDIYLVDIASMLGTRESHRILAEHLLSREEVLSGHRFDDAITQGTYPIDIHTPDGPGIVFQELDGTWRSIAGDGSRESGRWDDAEPGAPLRDTLCYQVPYRCLLPQGLTNVLAAGRCVGATHESAGAIRVMVNCMQLGQAAGTAAVLATDGDVRGVDPGQLRKRLVAAGVPLLAG